MVPEFQVVVLAAGKGSRITELTSRKPKCLLPIGNLPMVYYPLKLLEKSNFKEVFLVVLETSKSEVEFALEKTDLSLNIVIITIPDSDYGTAETLRQISSYIISDFIVISCDLLTTFNIKNILNVHRKNDAALTALFFQPQDLHFTNPGPKSKNKIEKDLIGVDPVTNRLVFLASASDYEDILPLKKKLLHKHGAIRMYTKLLDAHFFVMKKWILKYLLREKNISTIKGELLPNILKKEMSNENKLQNIINNSFDTTPIKEFSSEKANIADIFSLAKNNEFDVMARSMSSYNDHSGDLYPVYMNDYIRSYALIANESLGIRNNTLHDYCKSNRVIMKYWKDIVKNKESNISSEAEIESTQLQKENCFVDAHTKIAAKTSIQTSSLGRGCVVASKTRIVDCIIMNNVTIKESCVLQNCVICDDVTIEANCNIKDTVIGSRYCVSSNSSYANEVLAEIASLMEV